MDSKADKAKFNMFVGHMLNLTEKTSDTRGLEATYPNAPFMSVGTRLRGYDSAMDGGYMHCVRVESARLGRRPGQSSAPRPPWRAAALQTPEEPQSRDKL